MANSGTRLFYGWVIVAVATLALVVSNGLSIGGIPVFYKSIREEFVASGAVAAGSAESFIAFGATLTFFFAGILSPLAGWLIQRFRLRNLMLIGSVMLGSALIVHSQTASPTVVYLARTAMGISLCLVGVLPGIVLVSNWFVRRRGLALGILLTGTSIGGSLISLIAPPIIEAYGWRSAMVVVSLLIWLLLVPAVLLLVKDKPADVDMLPDGDGVGEDAAPVEVAGLTLQEALRTPLFWVLGLCAAAVFYLIFVTTQQFVLYLQSPRIGLSPEMGGLALSALFFVSISGKFGFGYLSDRFSPTSVLAFCCGAMFLSTLVLLRLSAGNAFLFLIPFGFSYGGAFVLLQRIAADFFGNRDYPKILGVLIVIETVGAAIGGLVTGRLADAAGGDYTTAFYVVIAVSGLAFLLTVALNFRPKSATK